ncbi:N-acetylmuramoyl-L-alanine amidase [Aquamicrobium sp. LC103]|uniref:N-acetylmuramoyl-L-alanine amidase n=1 Tax=Aquamicrobium sp. LC103 TaxID=1120658 RepID=UPI00063EC33B|nr:N-acetylmuramoyl-L-alanine amidase [Aquamicrobium sp. LC103]
MKSACFLLLVVLCAVAARGASAQEILQADGYKMAGDASRVRIIMQFDREPEVRWLLLRNPHRLVVDLPETAFRFDEAELEPRGMVTDVRHGNLESGASRVIVSMDTPFEVEHFEVVQNESSPGYRLVADIVASSEKAFEAALSDQIGTTGATQTTRKVDRLATPTKPETRKFTVVVDAGHGGIDSGAESSKGTLEKTITLAFALELKKRLDDTSRYDVYLTRDRDVFLRLDERVRIARQHEADLFISVHADTIRLKGISGATVYTVSDKASDAEAAAKAIRENLSDEIAGIEVEEQNQGVADILVDLIRRETHSFSMRFARSLVGELSNSIEMINNPHRFAGFRVLRAPDVPSVLLELGYLSNEADEVKLRDPKWRAKAIDSIVSAIDMFAAAKAGAGG